MKSERFVFDTNAIISAVLLRNSPARRAFDHAREQGILLVSIDTLTELTEVLQRPRFDKYISKQERTDFLALFVGYAETIEITV